MPNYVQPDFRNPVTPGVTVQVENNKNPLNVTAPQTASVQPGTSAPAAPVAGQLSTTSPGSIGTSGAVRADGTRIF
jgi:hypothetical protein